MGINNSGDNVVAFAVEDGVSRRQLGVFGNRNHFPLFYRQAGI
jgi:hypothetical protein